MYVTHLQAPPIGGPSGTIFGTLYANTIMVPHLHIELRIDGVYVPPEFMCAGGGVGGGGAAVANGWVVRIPRSQLGSMVASTPSQYGGQTTCSWGSGLSFAFNANFYNPNTQEPEAPAGYNGSYTNNDPVTHPTAQFVTFTLDNSNNPEITTVSTGGGNWQQLTTALGNLSQYRLIVTGVSEDSFQPSVANSKVGRTVLGVDSGGNVYIGVFTQATVNEALNAVRAQGAGIQAFHLDGGVSSTICQDGAALFGNTRNVGNNIGTNAGDILEL